ncbi:5-methylcytosine-specific restriction enzyme subunit McrC family protein [Gemella bergeri ATCC 700627]|uniref:5-methylcytosine-specific restriction enzyme subunit McrC family protein n=1 Tax=Gemella bergeri ATCC 700627 TaxID=1321820 RepID=U2S0C4_9BACL|nr:5-methylcytosine-specific restriction endonuclease system specificity protein McrC [Gemella bergeri]ERK59223.1 5-methylcytosine-specific restriction enzyme subunit McrC family protein [Gemella bergeri ATCC 700627]
MKNKKVLIKNIYYMLSYAFQNINQKNYENIDFEEFEEMYDMLSAILAKGIGTELKQGLYREYVNKKENISVMRGKVNIQGTIKNQYNNKRILSCEFDELSENNIYNQILKSTIIILLKNKKIKEKYKKDLKKKILFFSNVETINISNIKWNAIKFQKYNQNYRMLINICRLIVEGLLFTTDKGEYKIATLIDEQRMSRLYEKFILEYYKKNFPELSVTSSQIPWIVDDGIRNMLPIMKTDIHIQKDNTVLIIDAKYYSQNTQIYYNKNTIHSNNIYQIFTYVKNCDYKFEKENHTVSGMLLYAKTEDDIQPNNTYNMHGNQISVRTLDLYQNFKGISKQLNNIIKNHFEI